MTYEEQHAALIADLRGKLARSDWHGVSDAANDLRVLEAGKPYALLVDIANIESRYPRHEQPPDGVPVSPSYPFD